MGHDIGCKTAKMVKAHPQLGLLAAKNNLKSIVGAFHGLGHGRLCSICNMSMYVNGMGLEDCENCESYFSKSNALASITRYSTVFHRQQAIANYMKHTDLCDAYQGLSKLGLPGLLQTNADGVCSDSDQQQVSTSIEDEARASRLAAGHARPQRPNTRRVR
jgi:hypothetical protein